MCGFVGIIGKEGVAAELHLALQSIQHRGQDSAGIATMDAEGREFRFERGLGSVISALPAEALERLSGPIGLGHVRYPTIGQGNLEDTQPFFYRQPGVLMAHNGNITNVKTLETSLLSRSIHLMSHCDVEPVLCEFADALMECRRHQHTIDDAMTALSAIQARVKGGYSFVASMLLDGKPTLIVFRDPNGIRPCIIGQREGGSYIAASESVALDVLNFERSFEPQPGEAVFLRQGEAPIRRSLERKGSHPCIFEFIYFARPDSVMHGESVYEMRRQMGTSLAERLLEKSVDIDVVVPIPDTSRPAAAALAERLNLPLREGLIKNRYSGRTFIMPDQISRETALKLKLNPLPSELRGKRVVLVDDSIVRGTTLKRVAQMVRNAGATEVHLAIHAPPVKHPCFYGIDMSTREELFAAKFDDDLQTLEPKAAEALGADSLTYLEVEKLNEVFGGKSRCGACFDGSYPEEVPESSRLEIIADRSTIERGIS